MSNILACYQLLELNVIAAQDLAPISRSMRTYAVAWIDPDRKLTTRVDSHGGTNPNWNDKFVFRIDEDFLFDENSTITIEIYALHWFRDIHVGTAHVLAEDISPPSLQQPSHKNTYKPSSMRFVGLQVHRPSGRPKGLLNIGVAIIDSSMRSMPLYTHDNTSSIGYHQDHNHNELSHQMEPELRRSKSDTSSIMNSEVVAHENRTRHKGGTTSSQITLSEVSGISKKKTSSSILSDSDVKPNKTQRRRKFGRRKKNHKNEHMNATPKVSYQNERVNATPKVSYDYDYDEVKPSPMRQQFQNIAATPARTHGGVQATPARTHGGVRATPARTHGGVQATPARTHGGVRATPLHAYAVNNAAAEYGTPFRSNLGRHRPMMTNSELGPSASEVAAIVARQPVMEEEDNSTIGGWTMDESVEDLEPKIDRWVTESSLPASSSKMKGSRHSRRRTDGDAGGNGLFSCFSVICGVEVSIVCGGDHKKGKGRSRRSQSVVDEYDDASFL